MPFISFRKYFLKNLKRRYLKNISYFKIINCDFIVKKGKHQQVVSRHRDDVAKYPVNHYLVASVKFLLGVALFILCSMVWRAGYRNWFSNDVRYLRTAVEQSEFRIGWIEPNPKHVGAICTVVPRIRSLIIVCSELCNR